MAKAKDLRALASQATGALLDRSAAARGGGPAAVPAVRAARDLAEQASAVGGDRSTGGHDSSGNAPETSAAARPRHHFAPSHTTDRQVRRDIYDVDPRRILEQGPYIREWDEEGPEFERLRDAVRARGHIDTPLWVRSSGGAGNRRVVLIAGKGRLRAALASRLPWVPVRDFGEIDDRAAVLLQAQENFDRVEMTPAQTAHTFYLMTEHGLSQKEIGALRKKNPGYVSVMVRIGDALQALGPMERLALDRPGALQVRQCQVLAAAGGRDALVAGLRDLAAHASAAPQSAQDLLDDGEESTPPAADAKPAPTEPESADARREAVSPGGDRSQHVAPASTLRLPGRRPPSPPEPFAGRAIRGGRTFRMRWEDGDVQRDPLGLARGFVHAFQTEGAQLRAAMDRASGTASDESARNALARAQEALDVALQRLAELDSTGAGKATRP